MSLSPQRPLPDMMQFIPRGEWDDTLYAVLLVPKGGLMAYQPADFFQCLTVCQGAGVSRLVAFPQEAGHIPTACLHMAIKAVVCQICAAPLEPGVLNPALPHIKVAGSMILFKLQSCKTQSK